MKPNFIIAGERRSGTTSLANYFKSHPEIYLHSRIDMAYFVDPQTKGLKDTVKGKIDSDLWEKKFSSEDYISLFKDAKNEIAVGEKSADYFFWKESHHRIKKTVPDVKIILSLRNPVERCWSHYLNELGKGRETLSFKEALRKEKERIEFSDYARNHLSYLKRGFYDETLEFLYETFDREQIHVVILEELIKRPEIELEKVYNFVGVNPKLGVKFKGGKINKNWTTFQYEWVKNNSILSAIELFVTKLQRKILSKIIKQNYKRKQWSLKIESLYRKTKDDINISVEEKNFLSKIYEDHIDNLERILNRDLSIWKNN